MFALKPCGSPYSRMERIGLPLHSSRSLWQKINAGMVFCERIWWKIIQTDDRGPSWHVLLWCNQPRFSTKKRLPFPLFVFIYFSYWVKKEVLTKRSLSCRFSSFYFRWHSESHRMFVGDWVILSRKHDATNQKLWSILCLQFEEHFIMSNSLLFWYFCFFWHLNFTATCKTV